MELKHFTQEDVDTFNDQGFVVCRALFTPEEAAEIRAACEQIIDDR